MARFLKDNDLNSALENLFENANSYLLLVSPYIKLHARLASILKSKQGNTDFRIILVFGKNENDLSKSFSHEDFLFFKDFPEIEIRHEKRLHAKYYENEDVAILTSMNLYSYSQDNNIEAGVLINRRSTLQSFTNSNTLDDEAYVYFERVTEQSTLLYKREAKFDSGILGLGKKYISSDVTLDKLSDLFKARSSVKEYKGKEIVTDKPSSKPMGFCIRTGVKIPFNLKYPLADLAYHSWKKYSNKDFKEKFCHFSGEESHGETTFANPVLRKNWLKSKQIHS